MKKMKRIAAMTAALLICSGTMGYMPAETLKFGGFAAAAAGDVIAESVEINETNFPDANFRQYVAENFDKDGDGVLSAEEISEITKINIEGKGISDLTGIEYFTALEILLCNNNQLASLNISNNTTLTELNCESNQLTTLDLSNNPGLTVLYCGWNQLTSLDVSNNTTLTKLTCQFNQLTSLDASSNIALTYLDCRYNNLTLLNVSKNMEISILQCFGNQLTSLDVSNNTALTDLNCMSNQLTSLDVSNNTALIELNCNDNQLTSLDVSNNKKLTTLWCDENQLTSLNASKNTMLKNFYCSDNTYIINLTDGTFDLSTLPPSFDVTKTSNWSNGTIDGNILTVEDNLEIITYTYNCGNYKNKTFTLIPANSGKRPVVKINEINFPDERFRTYINLRLNNTMRDQVLSADEIEKTTIINLELEGISDLTGIEYFTSLEILLCDNNQLTSLDVSKNTLLTNLNCRNNQLTSLNVSDNNTLTNLDCSSNQLTSLDVSNNTSLTNLNCGNNQLTSLDVSNNTSLTNLACASNQLTSLDVSKNTALTELICPFNQLTSLDAINNTALESISCYKNTYLINLTDNTFDLSTLPKGFDVTKASEWTNGTVNGNILTVEDITKEVTYKYDCGKEQTVTFTLIPTNSTETPEKPPVSTPVVSLGDISGDGSIDSSDATLVLSDYAVIATGGKSTFTAEQAKAADVNGDGKYDSIDASLILAYYGYTSTGGTGTIEDYLADMN